MPHSPAGDALTPKARLSCYWTSGRRSACTTTTRSPWSPRGAGSGDGVVTFCAEATRKGGALAWPNACG